MEGSFWRLGHDLADIYTGRMSLRRLQVCIDVIVQDPKSPLVAALREAHAEAERQAASAALDDVHTRYRK